MKVNLFHLVAPLAGAAMLGACMAEPQAARVGPPERMIPDAGDECGATGLSQHHGDRIAALALVDPAGGLRVLRPGQNVRSDLSLTRLNVQLDDDGRILRLFCG